MTQPHILLVTFPAQGHINPILQFAKRLLRLGVRVTLATSESAIRRMSKSSATTLEGLSLAAYSDGYEDGFKPGDDFHHYMAELARRGSETLTEFIVASTDQGNPFTCIVYSILIPWVARIATSLNIPSTLLWNQTATMLNLYYRYFNGYGDEIENNINDPSFTIKLPGLPELASRDLPSFFIQSNPYAFAMPLFEEQLKGILDKEVTKPKVLVNTFDALEHGALKGIDRYNLVGIGPLIPSAVLGGKDPSDTTFGGVLIKATSSHIYIEWLNSKPESSVIYVAFGSMSVLSKPQMEGIAMGLIQTSRPFLWVIRENEGAEVEKLKEEEKLSCIEELEHLDLGRIVPWCSQVEVLSHKSIGCFVTHCGWNSTFESLCSGVPLIGFPQWTDQTTNAKMVEDVWKTGVRVNFNKESGIVEGEEIKKCLEIVMGGGERAKEMRENAMNWKELAREAAKEGGSSDKNLKDFVTEISEG